MSHTTRLASVNQRSESITNSDVLIALAKITRQSNISSHRLTPRLHTIDTNEQTPTSLTCRSPSYNEVWIAWPSIRWRLHHHVFNVKRYATDKMKFKGHSKSSTTWMASYYPNPNLIYLSTAENDTLYSKLKYKKSIAESIGGVSYGARGG